MPPRKKPPTAPRKSKPASANPAPISKPTTPHLTVIPPARIHASSYHWPLLLGNAGSSKALLQWFEGVEEERSMPWRKKWIDPGKFEGSEEELRKAVARRAYEVWVSEVMLQQTRVSTVIPYFKAWISKWPTIQDLAKANHDQILAVWKGLGYYSRATRLHQGAQAMVSQNSGACTIPCKIEELQEFPGIGRYTAGAISSIAFGEPEPVLDGNVARVLSRQLGLYVNVKDKKANDLLWEVADQLVKHVSGFPETQRGAVPGNWNQAMMELGSTICTPRPKCGECPVQKTCRAYAEGQALAEKKDVTTGIPDIEDACSLCEQLDTEELVTAPKEPEGLVEAEGTAKKRKRGAKPTNTISHYFGVITPSGDLKADTENDETADEETHNGAGKRKAPAVASPDDRSISAYCSLFPKKVAKKKAAEEECVVCIIELRVRGENSKWLIEQRPAKGLLASLWQFPEGPLPTSKNSAIHRKTSAKKFISGLEAGHIDMGMAKHVAELDSLVHVFTHLRLTMHVHLFRIVADKAEASDCAIAGPPARRWIDTDAMDNQTLSTGMRKCWDLLQKAR